VYTMVERHSVMLNHFVRRLQAHERVCAAQPRRPVVRRLEAKGDGKVVS
jgi:hypothetical protein